MAATFRTALFGGFDRGDVIAYIENAAQENQEQVEWLTSENNSLRHANEAMKEELATLKGTAERFAEDASKYQELLASFDAMKSRNETLEAENAELRGVAEEYRAMKDHIAEIEINAHRRTEEFRAAAIEKLHETVARQREWCDAQQRQYAAFNESLLQKLRTAQESLESADLSGFRAMDERLQALDRSLDE